MEPATNALYSRLAKAVEYGRSISEDEVLGALFSEDPHILWLAIKACGLLGVESSIDRLFVLAQTIVARGAPDIAMIASWSLARIDSDKVRATAVKYANSANAGERRVAADLLGLLREDNCAECLQRLLGDSQEEIALLAALSLSRHGAAAVDRLEAAVSTMEDTHRIAFVLDALDKIGSQASTLSIERIISQRDEPARTTLRRLLGEIHVHNEFLRRERTLIT